VAGSVVCGTVAACPLANNGQCCYTASDSSAVCQASGATCESTMSGSGSTYTIRATLQCDSSSDCSGGQICCYSQVYVGNYTACMTAAACVTSPATGGGYTTYRYQVCDPNQVAPTECLTGTCKPTTSTDLPAYFHTCQQ
jgi:hypothetical protein